MSAAESSAVVLIYHRVHATDFDPWRLSIAPERFEQHLEVLASSFRPISLAELRAQLRDGTLAPRSVAVTFDDGYLDLRTEALPLLERFRIPATYFVVSSTVGSRDGFWWDELASILLFPGRLPGTLDLSLAHGSFHWDLGDDAEYGQDRFDRFRGWRAWGEPDPSSRHALFRALWERLRELGDEARRAALARLAEWSLRDEAVPPAPDAASPILDAEDLRALLRSDLVEIGAHTRTHPRLAGLALTDQRREIEEGKRELEALTGQRPTSFSYPFGGVNDYTEETVELVRGAGFETACSNHRGLVRPDANPLRLPRVHVGDVDGSTFRSIVEGCFAGR